MNFKKNLSKLRRINKFVISSLKIIGILSLVSIVRLISITTRQENVELKTINFFNRFFEKPALGGRKGAEDYFLWQFSSGKRIYDYIQDESFTFKLKNVLDLGCGRGGKTAFYKSEGAAVVVGVDLREETLKIATYMIKKQGIEGGINFMRCNAVQLPFRSESFDLIIMNDMVEHISPADLIMIFKEAGRVLKTSGCILLDFSPFFNPRGSHLYDFVYIPYCHLLFSKKALIKYCENRATPFVIRQFQELNKITLKQFCRIVSEGGLKIKKKKVFSSSNVFKNVPIVNNLFINKIFCILGKS